MGSRNAPAHAENCGGAVDHRFCQPGSTLSRNAPPSLRVILANCLAHARRHFIDVVRSFPAECRFVLETLRAVFHHDALALQQELTPEERLRFHQQHRLPLMDGLHLWCQQQFDERRWNRIRGWVKRFNISSTTGRN